ncbi:MAG: hypothetical protein HZB54_04170 [Deltaproteobacteria bacterium]|nr:hypothetical protein [Deltaproteobacteria bacterium]
MIEYLPSAISSLKAAKDIIIAIQELRDIDKIKTATSEVKERLIETIDSVLASKEQLLSFQTKISDLEKECNRLKDWSIEREQYSCKQIGDGVFAFINSDFKGNFQDARKLCCNCFDKTIKSTLQQSNEFKQGMGRITTLTCPNGCPKLEFTFYASN